MGASGAKTLTKQKTVASVGPYKLTIAELGATSCH